MLNLRGINIHPCVFDWTPAPMAMIVRHQVDDVWRQHECHAEAAARCHAKAAVDVHTHHRPVHYTFYGYYQ
jgi:hypothetical protein